MLRKTPIAMTFTGIWIAGFMSSVYAQTNENAKQESAQKVQRLPKLPEVKVTAQQAGHIPRAYAGQQIARGGRLGLLGNMNVMKMPFSFVSYTSKGIQDKQAMTVADILSGDASVRSTGQSNGIVDAFFIRGFPIGEGNLGEIAFDGQYGVAPNYRVFAEYIERVEVIKGPAALLVGLSPNSGIGGVINVVPKRALTHDQTQFTADYASNFQRGGHLDFSRRFGLDRQFGIRINASHHQGNTPLDKQSRQANIGALALDYQGEQFRASLDLIRQKETFDAPSRPFLATAGLAVPHAPNGRRNVTQAWGWSEIEDTSLLLSAERDLSDTLMLFTHIGAAQSEVGRLSDQTHQFLNAAGDTQSTPMYYKFNIERASADAGLRARFATGAVRHTASLQASLYRDRLSRGSTSGMAVLSNLYSPVEHSIQNLSAPAQVPKISETQLLGFALADTLSIFDERLRITLGVRQQQVKSENFSPTNGTVMSSYNMGIPTPLIGLVIQPWKAVSFYANYIEGLSKGDIAPPTANNAGEILAPYRSKQNEIGVKIDQGRLITTLSVFQIHKPSGQLIDTIFSANAEQRNRGLELSLAGEVAQGVRLLAGMTLLDAQLTESNSSVTRGKTPVGVPSFQANLAAEWESTWVPGLTLSSAITYIGKQYIDQANTHRIPSWTKVDLGVRYRTQIARTVTTFRAHMLNIFNRRYWSDVSSFGAISAGSPRSLLLSATINF